MKVPIFGLIAVLFLFSSVATADQASRRAIAEELYAMTGMEQFRSLTQEMIANVQKRFDQLPATKRNDLLREKYTKKTAAVCDGILDIEAMKNAFVADCVEAYTDDQLKTVLTFFKSTKKVSAGETPTEEEQKAFADFFTSSTGKAWFANPSNRLLDVITKGVSQAIKKMKPVMEEMEREIRQNLYERSEQPITAEQ